MWKQYLISKGLAYNEITGDFRKGLGWGRTLSVDMLMKGLFEIKVGEEVLFSDFVHSFSQFKTIIDKHI